MTNVCFCVAEDCAALTYNVTLIKYYHKLLSTRNDFSTHVHVKNALSLNDVIRFRSDSEDVRSVLERSAVLSCVYSQLHFHVCVLEHLNMLCFREKKALMVGPDQVRLSTFSQ